MTVKNKPGRWQSGVSGNPKGKTPGSGQLQKLRASIANDVPDILAGLVTAAKAGDMQAARLILERVLPPIKAIEQAVALQLPEGGTLTAKAAACLRWSRQIHLPMRKPSSSALSALVTSMPRFMACVRMMARYGRDKSARLSRNS